MSPQPTEYHGRTPIRRPRWEMFLLSCLTLLLLTTSPQAQSSTSNRPTYRSPIDVAYSPDGALLAVADRTLPGLALIDPSDGSVTREVKLAGDPYHVIWNDGKVLVAEGANGTVAEVDPATGNVLRRLKIGLVAKGLAATPDGRLLTCDRARNRLVITKLDTGAVESMLEVGREPGTVAVTGDGQYAVVGNKLPRAGNRWTGHAAAEVSVVTLASNEVRPVLLAEGSTMVRHVVLSPDGRWAYVTHQSPRGGLPVTQLDNGWAMTNALSIVDVTAATLYANFIFDSRGSGAATPWGATINGDGSKLFVALAGVREVATVDLVALHKRLAAYTQKQRVDELLLNLSDLHTDGTIKRTALTSVEGTRGVALSTDNKTLAVAAYFSGKILLLSANDVSLIKSISLPNQPEEDQIRMGERYYYSALNCYQTWLSCSSCHDEGRPDSLNWDLQNDGTGNPKQTKSHIFSSETAPTNVSGCRENALVSSRAGYQFIEFQAAPEDRVQATYAFVKSLQPEPSPFLGADGKLTADAFEGKKLFEGSAQCSSCHKGQYFTDMSKHDVGTRRSGADGPDNNPTWDTAGYDTPTLIEVWRTAPYLHLGTALTVQDVLTTENKNGTTHGKTAHLSAQEIDQIATYVLQIGPTREGSAAPTTAPDGLGGAPPFDTETDVPASFGGANGSSSGGTNGDSNRSNRTSLGGATTDLASFENETAGDTEPKASSCVCSLGTTSASRRLLPLTALTLAGLAFWARRARRRRV